jgi:hypothetical protein
MSLDIRTDCVRYDAHERRRHDAQPGLAARQAWHDWFNAERDRTGIEVWRVARIVGLKLHFLQEVICERQFPRPDERARINAFFVSQGGSNAPEG